MIRLRKASSQKGFTFLIALFLVTILSVISLRAVEHAMVVEQRAKEVELLFVGQAYRQAIQDYYENPPGSGKAYPTQLSDMLEDVRKSTKQRTLRRLYADPMMPGSDWKTVTDSSGNIMGVYSSSTQKPLKITGFPAALQQSFVVAKTYQDWTFTYTPVQQSQSAQ